TPMIQVSGITGAGPIFKRVLAGAMAGREHQALVDTAGLSHAAICPLSGERAGPHCPASMDELFIAGTVPRRTCPMHTRAAAGLSVELQRRCGEEVTDLGVDYYDWAQRTGLQDEPWLASACRGAAGEGGGLKVLSPTAADEYLVLDDLPLADQ